MDEHEQLMNFRRDPLFVSETLPLADLPPDPALYGDPSKTLVESLRDVGQVHPIVVRDMGNAEYEVIDGRRRVKALRLLERESVEAHIVDPGDYDPLLIAAQLHSARSENVGTLVDMLRELAQSNPDPRQLAALTGYSVATVKKYLPLTGISTAAQRHARRAGSNLDAAAGREAPT